MNRHSKSKIIKSNANGFSMVEVLIAGVLLASALTAVSRIMVTVLGGSGNLATRAKIEAAINDNIQTHQKEDSYLTVDWIKKNPGSIAEYIQNSKTKYHHTKSKDGCSIVDDPLSPYECISALNYYFDAKGLNEYSSDADRIEKANKKNTISSCNDELKCACAAPDLILRMHSELMIDDPRTPEVERSFDYDPEYHNLTVNYSFEGPEQQIKKEKRTIEMTPNFSSNCFST